MAQTLAALPAGATSALPVVLAARRLHTSGGGYGLLLGAIAVGAFTGPVLLARLPALGRRPAAVFSAFLAESLGERTIEFAAMAGARASPRLQFPSGLGSPPPPADGSEPADHDLRGDRRAVEPAAPRRTD